MKIFLLRSDLTKYLLIFLNINSNSFHLMNLRIMILLFELRKNMKLRSKCQHKLINTFQ